MNSREFTPSGSGANQLSITMVTANWMYSGLERVVRCLLKELPAAYPCMVSLTIAGRTMPDGRHSAQLFPLPETIPVVHIERARLHNIIVPLARCLKTASPDVIFCNVEPEALVFYWLAAVLAGKRKALIAVHHEPVREGRRTVKGRIAASLTRMVVRNIPLHVAVSRGVAAAVARSLNVPESHIRTIYNPFDPGEVQEATEKQEPSELVGNHPVVLTVARLMPPKDFETLIRAFDYVTRRLLAFLCIVGEGPGKSGIEALVHDLDLEGRVLLSGFSTEPYAYMKHSQVFVLSSFSEGFSMVLLEAMACGLPVVATDCDWGPREIVTNGVDGLLVPPQEPELMGRAILALLEDRDMAIRLAKAGTVRAHGFAVADAVKAYHDAAMECVRSKK